MMRYRHVLVMALVVVAAAGAGARQQAPPAVSGADVQAAIDKLGSFDFPVRTEASRVVRRASSDVAVPLLARAARAHADEYVRYRALTLLSGFGGPTTATVMQELKSDRNDRLRTVAFAWFEHQPTPAALPSLIEALQKERSEFVRPALTRSIAAHTGDPRVREALLPLVSRGDDYFRGAVIEALGDYDGKFALAEITAVAKLDGPLQDDAIAALAKLGDKATIPMLLELQKTAPREVQPTIAASLCLLGTGCPVAEEYLKKTLAFAATTDGYSSLLRGVVHAYDLLAVRGRPAALGALFDAGVPAREAARGPLALGVGHVALRQPATIITALEPRTDLAAAIELLRDAFDMLNEDFEEERFFVEVRRVFWASPAGSARRAIAEALMSKLEF
jgi:HEAT repeat protein